MEAFVFLSYDDLVEQERDHIQHLLDRRRANAYVEFALTMGRVRQETSDETMVVNTGNVVQPPAMGYQSIPPGYPFNLMAQYMTSTFPNPMVPVNVPIASDQWALMTERQSAIHQYHMQAMYRCMPTTIAGPPPFFVNPQMNPQCAVPEMDGRESMASNGATAIIAMDAPNVDVPDERREHVESEQHPVLEQSMVDGRDESSKSPITNIEMESATPEPATVSVAVDECSKDPPPLSDHEEHVMVDIGGEMLVDANSCSGVSASLQSPSHDDSDEPEKPKLWSSLFRSGPTAKKAIVKQIADVVDDELQGNYSEEEALRMAIAESTRIAANGDQGRKGEFTSASISNIIPTSRDSTARKFTDALKNYKLVDKGPSFVLRGIVNSGNWCYVNATLQALIACPTFFHLLRFISSHLPSRSPTATPVLDAFTQFVSEIILVEDKYKNRAQSLTESPLDPDYLYDMVSRLRDDSSFKGHQEDAEEFLLLVLNRLHEEMADILGTMEKDGRDKQSNAANSNVGNGEAEENSEWCQVVRGKTTVTRQVKHATSPISEIFSGQFRCGLRLNQTGAKESVIVEPFFTVPLDVQLNGVTDLVSALKTLTTKETLKYYQGRNKTEVDATRRVTFSELPRVLIFQLKYFVYSEEALKKIVKRISYPMDLRIDKDIWTHVGYRNLYKLFAVVFHHGEKAEGGHYTADVFHGGKWWNVDDTKMMMVTNDHVLQFQPPRVPYLLFYRRMGSS